MRVHWFKPTNDSRELQTASTYWKHNFEEEMDLIHIRTHQRGPKVRAEPRVDDIEYDMVHFGFNRLLPNGKLAKEVLNELRSRKLIQGR